MDNFSENQNILSKILWGRLAGFKKNDLLFNFSFGCSDIQEKCIKFHKNNFMKLWVDVRIIKPHDIRIFVMRVHENLRICLMRVLQNYH